MFSLRHAGEGELTTKVLACQVVIIVQGGMLKIFFLSMFIFLSFFIHYYLISLRQEVGDGAWSS